MKSLAHFVQKFKTTQFVDNVAEALKVVKSGDFILLGGFGVCGLPEKLCADLVEYRKGEVDNLTVACCTAGLDDIGPGLWAEHGMMSKLHASYIGQCENVISMYWGGDIEVQFTPQGTLAEKMRAAGAGIPAFYTPTGVGTVVEYGGFPQKYDKEGNVEIESEPKEKRVFNGREYLMEHSIYGDVAFVKGHKADKAGNITCRGTALNFNPCCAQAAKYCIAEVEEIVEIGELKPEEIDIQGIFVDVVYKPEPYEKTIEFLTYAEETGEEEKKKFTLKDMEFAKSKEQIARRVALEYGDGEYCNVGIGIPTLSSNYLPEGVNITLQSENGILGLGGYPTLENVDADLTNASKQTVTLLDGASLFDSVQSFAVIRGKHVDMTCLGGMQVSATGDLANWVIPGRMVTGMGGAMDLVGAGTKVIICMEHCSKDGKSKIKEECTLPLTGKGVVNKIVTEFAVFDVIEEKLVLSEKAFWKTVEDIENMTEAKFTVSENLKDIEYSL